MKGNFKRGKLPADLRSQGFEENKPYDCYYNGSGQLVVQSENGGLTIITKNKVEDTFSVMPKATIFKITSKE